MRRGQKRQKIAKNRRRNPKQPTEPEGHRFKGRYDYEYWQKIIPRKGAGNLGGYGNRPKQPSTHDDMATETRQRDN